MPNLSIVIPVRNRPELLRRTLRSLADGAAKAAATGATLETIVVDDGSDLAMADQTRAACRELAGCLYLRMPTRRGAAAACNHGAAIATSGAIWFLDAGNKAEPETLETIASAVVARATADQLLTLPMQATLLGEPREALPPTAASWNVAARRRRQPSIHTSCLILPRWLFDRIGGWDERLAADHDPTLLSRASRHTSAIRLSTVGVLVEQRDAPPLLRLLPHWTHRHAHFLAHRWQQFDPAGSLRKLRTLATGSVERWKAIDRPAIGANIRRNLAGGFRYSTDRLTQAAATLRGWWREPPWATLRRHWKDRLGAWQDRLAMRRDQYDDVPLPLTRNLPSDDARDDASFYDASNGDDRRDQDQSQAA